MLYLGFTVSDGDLEAGNFIDGPERPIKIKEVGFGDKNAGLTLLYVIGWNRWRWFFVGFTVKRIIGHSLSPSIVVKRQSLVSGCER